MKIEFEMSIDNFVEQIFDQLERGQDGDRGHWASYFADTETEAVDRALQSIRPLIVELMRNRQIEE